MKLDFKCIQKSEQINGRDGTEVTVDVTLVSTNQKIKDDDQIEYDEDGLKIKDISTLTLRFKAVDKASNMFEIGDGYSMVVNKNK